MANQPKGTRPLSPFMLGPYYRIQLTSVSSMLVRITGNALLVSFALAVWWLAAAATSDAAFGRADAFATSWFGDLVFTLSLLGLWYHFLGGLRHLYFDAGKGLEIETAELLGWVCIIGSVVLTALSIIAIWLVG